MTVGRMALLCLFSHASIRALALWISDGCTHVLASLLDFVLPKQEFCDSSLSVLDQDSTQQCIVAQNTFFHELMKI